MQNIVDTHSHLFVEEFNEDRNQAVTRALESGITHIVTPNIDMESLEPMLNLCADYPRICHPTIGLHPTEVKEDYREVLQQMEPLIPQHPFVAIGEIGLDFYWDTSFKREQLTALDKQIQWALTYNLPVIIHSREAFEELHRALLPYRNEPLCGIFHSFTGTADEALALLDFPGFMLGINGVVTFKKSTLPEALQPVPLNRLVVETDSPYLTPVPYRGKRNESAYIVRVIEKLAEIYSCSTSEIIQQTTDNACRIFHL